MGCLGSGDSEGKTSLVVALFLLSLGHQIGFGNKQLYRPNVLTNAKTLCCLARYVKSGRIIWRVPHSRFSAPHKSKLTWSEQSIPYPREKGRMLRTYLGAKPLKPASKNKTIDQIFVHWKINLIEDWNYSALMFKNLGGKENGLSNHLLCSLNLPSALVSRIQSFQFWNFWLLPSGVCLASVLNLELCVFVLLPQQVSLICNWCLQNCLRTSRFYARQGCVLGCVCTV